MSFNFIYKNIEGKFIIIDYDVKTHIVTLKYKDTVFDKRIENLITCQISKEIGYIKHPYRYNSGEVLHKDTDLQIINQTKYTYPSKNYSLTVKAYTVKCMKCNQINTILENSINRHKCPCPVCSNKIIVKNINSIYANRPDLLIFFKNNEDAYTNSIGTNKKFELICPRCRTEKTMSFDDFIKNGLACPLCSDGVSYPNKFFRNVLNQLNIDYETEKTFDWCVYTNDNNTHIGIYDNYISQYNLIIEIDGAQHLNNSKHGAWKRNDVDIDKQKEILAVDNGYDFIRIEAYESDMEYLKKSILQSVFSRYYDLSNIDWKKCDRIATSSNVSISADLWNKGWSIHMIHKYLGCAYATALKYLKQANKLMLCEYKPYDERRRNNVTKQYR